MPGRTQPSRRAQASRAQQPANGRYRSRSERNYELPHNVAAEIRGAVAGSGAPQAAAERRAAMLERRLASAAQAYERDRYQDALTSLRPLISAAPGAASVRELHGLILYRMGRWRQAVKELRRFHELSGSYDQHPVIADCERALGNWKAVRQVWTELRQAGVDREVLVEGRLVMAGALADEGSYEEAIVLLRGEAKPRRNPDLAHLRQWYALADIYERAGEIPRARELFARVAQVAPGVLDAPERLSALR